MNPHRDLSPSEPTPDPTPDNIAIVSGYWKVKNKYSHQHYDQWFCNSLKINQFTFFFCQDEEHIEYIRSFRGNLPTAYIKYSLTQFHSNQFYRDHWVHPVHVPSPELGKIWHEKIRLMKLVKDNDPTPREFYIWCDAGVCVYRDSPPPSQRLTLRDIHSLPHDKFCYSDPGNPPHDYHHFAGTVYIMHRSIIDTIYNLYMEYVQKCTTMYDDWRCGSDQVILTEIMRDHPDLFHKLSYGYGMNLKALYDHHV